jgi:hypothetical protein
MSSEPVFFDKTGRRWRVVKFLLIILALGLVSLPTAFVISAFTLQPAADESAVSSDSLLQATQPGEFVQLGRVASKHRLR